MAINLKKPVNATGWSISGLTAYDSCPAQFKYGRLVKLCPKCFAGVLMGWDPQVCDACSKSPEVGAPIVRGIEIDEAITAFIKGGSKLPETRHPAVIEILKKYREEYKTGKVSVQDKFVLNSKWEPISQYTSNAWFRGTTDVRRMDGAKAEVIDFKTGGIDKRTGGIRAHAKYDDQLEVYAIAVLSSFPAVQEVGVKLVFTDCGPRFNPVITGKSVTRKALPKLRKNWEKRLKSFFADTVHAPTPSMACNWCDYAKGKGGPCPF